MKMFSKIKGFTVIELMIGISIIGILWSLAVPIYQNYLIRSKVVEALSYGEHAKIAVSEYFQTNGVFPSNNTQVGVNSAALVGAYAKALAIGQNGVITITTSIAEASGSILLTPLATASSIKWDCSALYLEQKYLPSACKAQVSSSSLYNISAGSNAFTSNAEVYSFFGRYSLVDDVPARWSVTATILQHFTEAEWSKCVTTGCSSGGYNLSKVVLSKVVTKGDGTIVTNFNQFCGSGERGVVYRYGGGVSVSALACIRQ